MFGLQLRTTVIAMFLWSSTVGLTLNPEDRHESIGTPIASDDSGLSEEVHAAYANGTRHQILFQEAQGNEVKHPAQGNSIDLLGAWNTELGSKLFVKFTPYNNSISNEVIRDLEQSIHDNPSLKNVTDLEYISHSTWNNLLFQLANSSKSAPPTLDVSEFAHTANVTVTLTDKAHGTKPGRNGETVVEFNDKGEITRATITIYEASTLYAEGLLGAVFNHELGHALGLGHSGKLESVMYPSLVITENDNGENIAIGNIGTCELAGLTQLYAIVDNDHGSTGAPKIDSLECD